MSANATQPIAAAAGMVTIQAVEKTTASGMVAARRRLVGEGVSSQHLLASTPTSS